MMIRYTLDPAEVDWTAVRAQGAGGQNVNKVSSAIHLRFDIRASSLPPVLKERLLALSDQRITRDGIVVIKSQEYRTQEKNREAALARLDTLIGSVALGHRKAVKPVSVMVSDSASMRPLLPLPTSRCSWVCGSPLSEVG